MEKILRDIMTLHLINNKLLSPDQHGFVTNKSCVTNLLEALDIITESMNRGFLTVLIFLDFAKAFDRVNHQLLILKLRKYGFSGELLNWLVNFLSNRKQRVVIGMHKSFWIDVLSGTPQGSVLAPILFLIFINDMPDLVDHFCKLFADDSKLIGVIKNSLDRDLLQQDIDKLCKWSNDWSMSFNEDKCKTMVIKTASSNKILDNDFSYTMLRQDGSRFELNETTQERDLGIQINNKLKWNSQVDYAVSKGFSSLGTLKRTFLYWNSSMFTKLYTTYVRPHLEYCSAAWNPHLKKDIFKLESVQRAATKLVPEIRFLDYNSRLSILGLQKLSDRRTRGDLIQFYKIENNFNILKWHRINSPMASLSATGPAVSVRGSKHRLFRQFTKVEVRNQFLSNRIVSNWNKLPDCITESTSSNQFKN